MASVGWQSSDLLTRFNQTAGRPATDAITDPAKYIFLSDGQEAVITEVAGVMPKPLLGAPTLMTSADGGYTFTFGTDGNGYALFPIATKIYPSLNAIPDYPWKPGIDYLDEGVQIRMPNNIAWSGSLYWRGITLPQQISASVQPVIQPPPSRTLIVTKGVQLFAEQFLRNAALADQMEIRWQRQWPKHCTMMRRHFSGARASGSLTGSVGGPSQYGNGLGYGGSTW